MQCPDVCFSYRCYCVAKLAKKSVILAMFDLIT